MVLREPDIRTLDDLHLPGAESGGVKRRESDQRHGTGNEEFAFHGPGVSVALTASRLIKDSFAALATASPVTPWMRSGHARTSNAVSPIASA